MIWLIIIFLLISAVFLYFFIWYKLSKIRGRITDSPILLMHAVTDEFDLGISKLTSTKFKEYMEKTRAGGFVFGCVDKRVEELKNGKIEDGVIYLTFDDGYADFYRLFKEYLEPNSIPAAVFITAGYIGKGAVWDYKPNPPLHLSREELKELSQSELITIGAHSISHPELSRVSVEKVREEVVESKKILEDITGKEVKYFSYPFGRFNDAVIKQLKEAGYQAAFCGVPHRFNGGDNLFMIPRIPLNLFDNLFTFTQKTGQGPLYWMQLSRARVIEQYSCLTYRARGRR
ncbi:MAG: polysaccharide deacetylase family protein [candidate division Zixibacteria bacterium]|nr:polysaccharide deacetylase family protein [candidate division Zixibacteria bacterium]